MNAPAGSFLDEGIGMSPISSQALPMEAPPMWDVGMVAARALSSYLVTRLSCEKQSNSRFSPYGEQQLFNKEKINS